MVELAEQEEEDVLAAALELDGVRAALGPPGVIRKVLPQRGLAPRHPEQEPGGDSHAVPQQARVRRLVDRRIHTRRAIRNAGTVTLPRDLK